MTSSHEKEDYEKAELAALQLAHDALKAAEPYMSARLLEQSEIVRYYLRLELEGSCVRCEGRGIEDCVDCRGSGKLDKTYA